MYIQIWWPTKEKKNQTDRFLIYFSNIHFTLNIHVQVCSYSLNGVTCNFLIMWARWPVELISISPLVKVANFTTITTTNNGHILIRKAFDSGKLRDYIPKGFWLYKKKVWLRWIAFTRFPWMIILVKDS